MRGIMDDEERENTRIFDMVQSLKKEEVPLAYFLQR